MLDVRHQKVYLLEASCGIWIGRPFTERSQLRSSTPQDRPCLLDTGLPRALQEDVRRFLNEISNTLSFIATGELFATTTARNKRREARRPAEDCRQELFVCHSSQPK